VRAAGEAPAPAAGGSSAGPASADGELHGNPFSGSGASTGGSQPGELHGNPFGSSNVATELIRRAEELVERAISVLFGGPFAPAPSNATAPGASYMGGGTDEACPGASLPLIEDAIENPHLPKQLC
jgi:hypothetical protein